MVIEIQVHESEWTGKAYWIVWEDGRVVASGHGCESKRAAEKAALDAYIASRSWS